ncbi:MAG: hypothetical protein V2A62_04750 [Candidatus Woesearchaeota archaeon]
MPEMLEKETQLREIFRKLETVIYDLSTKASKKEVLYSTNKKNSRLNVLLIIRNQLKYFKSVKLVSESKLFDSISVLSSKEKKLLNSFAEQKATKLLGFRRLCFAYYNLLSSQNQLFNENRLVRTTLLSKEITLVDQLLFCLQESKVECVSIIYREIAEIKPPFRIKNVETVEEKKQLIQIFREGAVGGGYESNYDREVIAIGVDEEVLAGMQVTFKPKGGFLNQPCPTFDINNIGLSVRFWKKKSNLGTSLIQNLKDECLRGSALAIAMTSTRASELARNNGFVLLYQPDFWLWCLHPKDNPLCKNCRRTLLKL